MIKEIGIIGDFHNSKSQGAIADSIEHSNAFLGTNTSFQWIDTTLLDNVNYADSLNKLSGIWSASGSPFKSLNGALNAIKYARENMIPHIGTCGGYQHSIIEYARNVLGYKNAQHEEYSDEPGSRFIGKMTCSLRDTKGKVRILENTASRSIYDRNEIEVDYYCSYGLNPDYKSLVLNGDLIIGGIDINEEVRIIELKSHPFFIITAFVPQVDSTYEKPNPLITEFIKTVNSRISLPRNDQRQAGL
jgi:CTP synthase (UTP-ammonia lyase)